jgi:hypothetical protein
MKRSHQIQQKGDKNMRKQALSPEVEKFLFPNGRPSETLQMEEEIRRRIRSEAVREFLLPDKKV